jgi:hypothetical protein
MNLVFLYVFILNMLVNVDHGAIPAATKVLKDDLSLNNQQLGSLGSIVFIGIVTGKSYFYFYKKYF